MITNDQIKQAISIFTAYTGSEDVSSERFCIMVVRPRRRIGDNGSYPLTLSALSVGCFCKLREEVGRYFLEGEKVDEVEHFHMPGHQLLFTMNNWADDTPHGFTLVDYPDGVAIGKMVLSVVLHPEDGKVEQFEGDTPPDYWENLNGTPVL